MPQNQTEMSREEQDRKNKRAGIISSAVTHVVVLALFFFLIAWRAPNPPNPEVGIELNFGTSDQGMGDQQPDPADLPAQSESEEDTQESVEVTEEVQQPTEEVIQPVEEVVEETTETNETTVEETTPVVKTPTENPVKEPEKKKVVEAKPKEKVEEKPQPPKVLYPGTKTGQSADPKNTNQGDKTDAVGDQGAKEGTVDARSLYGKPGGGGGGAALQMTGWKWDREPNPNEKTTKDGKIVFEVTIDDRGEVISVKVVNYTVNASLVKIYQNEVEKLTFTKTSSGPVPPTTKGVITFIIKAK